MKKYKLAIVGATGLVGRTALKILEEKNIQNLEYTLFSSKKSAGTELKFMNTRYLVLFCWCRNFKTFCPYCSLKGLCCN